MSWDQIVGPLRAILPAIMAFAIGKGWISVGSADWLVSSILALGSAGYSVWSNRPAAVAGEAQTLPGVNVTTTSAASPAVTAAVLANK